MAKAPPKPLIGPNLFAGGLDTAMATPIPADVMRSWRGLWHSIGSALPFYINHSRANRRHLRGALRTHGR